MLTLGIYPNLIEIIKEIIIFPDGFEISVPKGKYRFSQGFTDKYEGDPQAIYFSCKNNLICYSFTDATLLSAAIQGKIKML